MNLPQSGPPSRAQLQPPPFPASETPAAGVTAPCAEAGCSARPACLARPRALADQVQYMLRPDQGKCVRTASPRTSAAVWCGRRSSTYPAQVTAAARAAGASDNLSPSRRRSAPGDRRHQSTRRHAGGVSSTIACSRRAASPVRGSIRRASAASDNRHESTPRPAGAWPSRQRLSRSRRAPHRLWWPEMPTGVVVAAIQHLENRSGRLWGVRSGPVGVGVRPQRQGSRV